MLRAAFSLALFTCWFVASVSAGPSKPVAVVNGEAIPRAEFDAVFKLRPQAVIPLAAALQRQIHEQIVAMLVDEVLLRQFLAKNAPPADPGAVEKQFTALVDSLKAQGKSLADYCKENQQTERQVKANIEAMQRWNAYTAKAVTDTAVQQYYAQNRDFFDKVTVRCSHIVLRVPAAAPPPERSEAERRLNELRAKITGGQMNFAEAAQQYSHCPTAPKGGDLGFIFRKWMVEEPFAKAAFALKVNEVSGIVATDFGLHLILVTERKPGEPSDFANVKDDVRDCCTEEMRLNLLTELRKAAKIEINLP
jgi:peptidyl-prolyl cis-trans isomerase C